MVQPCSAQPASPSPPRTFGFLVQPNFTTIGLASAVETLRMANLAACRPLFRTVVVAATPEPVTASNGMRVLPDHGIADAPALDALFVVGANPIANDRDSRPLIDWLRQLARQRVPWVEFARAATCWHGRSCSKATAAPSTGKTSKRSRSVSPASSSPTNCTSSIATATPVPAAWPPWT